MALTTQVTASSTLAVLERSLLLYRRLWRASAFSSFLLPVLFLISIGIGLGGHVGDIAGVHYLSWIVPGVLASTAFQMSVGECTYPVLGDFKWVRAYHAMRATPVEVGDMVCGWLLYILIRVQIAVVVFLAITALFGALHSPWALVTPLVCALVALAVAAPTMAFSASIEQDSYFAMLFRFVVIPSTLFAGVFFPVEQLPVLARPLAYVSPLWHGVELNRAATLGTAPPWPIAAHLAYLLVFAAVGVTLAVHAFRKRLQD
ncbi:ABC transporter permease [Sphaerisporangium flaviroseum]|uniref:Transport permease protein n=1 Tax=Sphaerisporangium flaviroseum TaxID=509199 RepID=A0ABP7J921_9ACTN